MSSDAEIWWAKPWRLHLIFFAVAVAVILVFGNPFETQELQWLGQCLRWRYAAGLTPKVEDSIMHLNIETDDLKKLSTLDSEYTAAARIIDEASALGASVIVFDIIFARGGAETAKPLLDAIAEHKNVVLAQAIEAQPGETGPSLPVQSFPFLSESPAANGLINLTADPDGVIRHYSFVYRNGDKYVPSLALAAYFASKGVNFQKDVSLSPSGTIQWKELSTVDYVTMLPRPASARQVPVSPVLLNLRCAWAVQTDPAAFDYKNLRELDELAEKNKFANEKPLANKIVFVSYLAIGQADLGATVFGSHEPLIYLHSTALNDLMQSRWLERSHRLFDALWISAGLLVVVSATWCRSKWLLLLAWVAGLAFLGIAGGVLLSHFNLIPPTVAAASMVTIATVLEIARRHTSELFERQRLRSTMGLYFSPRVLNDVLRNPGRLDPKRLEITVLLTDLRNSTTLAELLGTEGMLGLLNRIFAVENGAVFAEDGSMEKPVGDQFLAYWGAPDPQADAADRAFRAAMTLIERMHDLQETLDPKIKELFGYGLALHAGESLIGNIGSAQFFHYGPVGDLMNATARVESLTKYYGVLALATREFCNRLSRPADARIIDRVVVKGKNVPLELIELRHKLSADNFQEVATIYGEAFALYLGGKFSEAEKQFSSLSQRDRPSAILARRCAELAANPPRDWNGTFIMTTK